MLDCESIKSYLKNILSTKRYLHSINTAATAEKLAEVYKLDSKKAYIAGLVHDCTREQEIGIQQEMMVSLGIEVDELTFNTKELLHAYSAEYIIKSQFDINDEEIITAVRFHTTGRESMTTFEKIIFISDVIEPNRSFPGVDFIRKLSEVDLDEAMLAAFDSSIRFLIGKRSLIHPNTFFARNHMVKYFEKKEMGL